MTKPYYQDDHVTLYHGDAREIVPILERVDSVITDPVWPNVLEGLPGWEDPLGLLRDVAVHFPRVADRCVIHLGCLSDPRILTAIPDALPFFRVCWLEYVRPSYVGRALMTRDVAYVFGEPLPSKPGAHVMPGRFLENKIHPRVDGHPCPRKLGHVRWLVNWYGGKSVLDPFAGSCTTGIVCREVGIKCVCVEIDEGFCEAAARRLETSQRGIFEIKGVASE